MSLAVANEESAAPSVRPLSSAMGAEIRGVDLSRPLDDAAFGVIHQAFLDYSLLYFPDQDLTPEEELAFARRFGSPEVHPIVEGTDEYPDVIRIHKPANHGAFFGLGWHTDNTFFEAPSLGTMLHSKVVPPYGGDTLFCSMAKAYDHLSDGMKDLLSSLVAVHSARPAYDPAVVGEHKYKGEAPLKYKMSDAVLAEVEHPVIRTHPESGRKSIFVNPMFTVRFKGMTERESKPLLDFLFEHATQPEFCCRLAWQAGAVAMWDNRCTMHYAMDDYFAYERIMYRVTIAGDRPY